MAKTLIVRCMDCRLLDPVHKLLTESGQLGSCYDLALAGGAKCLTRECDEEKVAHSHIAIAIARGGVEEVILTAHTDCAAYASAGITFPEGPGGNEEEISFLVTELARAEKFVHEKFPEVSVTSKKIFVMHGPEVQELIELI